MIKKQFLSATSNRESLFNFLEGNTIVIIVDSNENIYSYNMNNGDLKVALLEVGDKITASVIESEIVKVEKRAK